MQVSSVQALLSSHITAVNEQLPPMHVSLVQLSLSSQMTGLFWQASETQVSVVQAFPSLQSSVSHASRHPNISLKKHEPLEHESTVQVSPSSQSGGLEQIPAMHVSLVQLFPSLQFNGI